MVRLLAFAALAATLSVASAQRGRRPGVECIISTSEFFPQIEPTIISAQQKHRRCASCTKEGVLSNGNATQVFTEWETEALDTECQKVGGNTCFASVSVVNTETHELFFMKDYTPICRPRTCLDDNAAFESALSRYATNDPSKLFWFAPVRSTDVLDKCNESDTCVFVFNMCGASVRLPYNSETIKQFAGTADDVESSLSEDDTAAAKSSSSVSTTLAVGIAGGCTAVVALVGLIVYKRNHNKELSFVPYE